MENLESYVAHKVLQVITRVREDLGLAILVLAGLLFILLLVRNLYRTRESFRSNLTSYPSAMLSVLVAIIAPIVVLSRAVSSQPTTPALIATILTILIVVYGALIQQIVSLFNRLEGYRVLGDSKNPKWSSDEVMRVILNAREKVALLQTWFPDAARIGDVLKELDSQGRNVEVELFLIDPNSELAHQRYTRIHKELLSVSDKSTRRQIAQPLASIQILASIDNFIMRLEKTKNISVIIKLYDQDHLPQYKLYWIDNDCFWGAFPGDGHSTEENPTFSKTRNLSEGELRMRRHAEKELHDIQASRPKEYYVKKPSAPGIFPNGRIGIDRMDISMYTNLTEQMEALSRKRASGAQTHATQEPMPQINPARFVARRENRQAE